MRKAVLNAHAPVFFIQPENDYDLAPSQVLSAVMKGAGKAFEMKIYPPYGESVREAHSFGYFGASIGAQIHSAF